LRVRRSRKKASWMTPTKDEEPIPSFLEGVGLAEPDSKKSS
jgi:hypothetical protein